jgi:hypothetical protein
VSACKLAVLLACPNDWAGWGLIVWFVTLWLSKMWCCCQCGGLGSISGQSMWDLWWTKLHLDRLFSQCLSFALSLSFHQCSVSHSVIFHQCYTVLSFDMSPNNTLKKSPQVWFGRYVPNCTVNFVLTTVRTSNLTMMLLNVSHPRSCLLCAPKSSHFRNCFN